MAAVHASHHGAHPCRQGSDALTEFSHVQACNTDGHWHTRYVDSFDVFSIVVVTVQGFLAVVVAVVVHAEADVLGNWGHGQTQFRQVENEVLGPVVRHELL